MELSVQSKFLLIAGDSPAIPKFISRLTELPREQVIQLQSTCLSRFLLEMTNASRKDRRVLVAGNTKTAQCKFSRLPFEGGGAMFEMLWGRRCWPQKKPDLGILGERAAEKFLRKQGYRILGRRVSFRGGEIDIIALQNQTIVFVEVKAREGCLNADPSQAVGLSKQICLSRTAIRWLKKRRLFHRSARFDVISIIFETGSITSLRHFQHAFEPHWSDR